VDRIIRDLKSRAPGIRKFDWAELETVEIGDAMAAETHQVMVMLRVAVETGHSLRVVRPADDAGNFERRFFDAWVFQRTAEAVR